LPVKSENVIHKFNYNGCGGRIARIGRRNAGYEIVGELFILIALNSIFLEGFSYKSGINQGILKMRG
jgi:hypothetical protein